jgi:hypothetical protein
MACDISGSGCKICPGMWIAGILLLVMTLQSFFFRASSPSKIPSQESASQTLEANDASNTPQQN